MRTCRGSATHRTRRRKDAGRGGSGGVVSGSEGQEADPSPLRDLRRGGEGGERGNDTTTGQCRQDTFRPSERPLMGTVTDPSLSGHLSHQCHDECWRYVGYVSAAVMGSVQVSQP